MNTLKGIVIGIGCAAVSIVIAAGAVVLVSWLVSMVAHVIRFVLGGN